MGVELLVVQHLEQVEADLLNAKRVMVFRLEALMDRLAADDPDRQLLRRAIQDLSWSILMTEEHAS